MLYLEANSLACLRRAFINQFECHGSARHRQQVLLLLQDSVRFGCRNGEQLTFTIARAQKLTNDAFHLVSEGHIGLITHHEGEWHDWDDDPGFFGFQKPRGETNQAQTVEPSPPVHSLSRHGQLRCYHAFAHQQLHLYLPFHLQANANAVRVYTLFHGRSHFVPTDL